MYALMPKVLKSIQILGCGLKCLVHPCPTTGRGLPTSSRYRDPSWMTRIMGLPAKMWITLKIKTALSNPQ
jgi:hypothetical protein